MKSILIGLAAVSLGTVGLASSSDPKCEGERHSSGRAAPASPLGFSTIGGIGNRGPSPV